MEVQKGWIVKAIPSRNWPRRLTAIPRRSKRRSTSGTDARLEKTQNMGDPKTMSAIVAGPFYAVEIGRWWPRLAELSGIPILRCYHGAANRFPSLRGRRARAYIPNLPERNLLADAIFSGRVAKHALTLAPLQ